MDGKLTKKGAVQKHEVDSRLIQRKEQEQRMSPHPQACENKTDRGCDTRNE
jgi:hypothetical protein